MIVGLLRKLVLLLAIFPWKQTGAKQLPRQKQRQLHHEHRRFPLRGNNVFKSNQLAKTKTIIGGFTSTSQFNRQNYVLNAFSDGNRRDSMHSGYNQAGAGFKRKVPNSDPYCLNKHQYNPMDTREQSMRSRDSYTDSSGLSNGMLFSQFTGPKSRHQHSDPSDRRLSSTDYGYYTESPRLSRNMQTLRNRILSIFSRIDVQESAIYLTYICNIIVASKYISSKIVLYYFMQY